MTCEHHGGNAGSIMCKFCDAETIEREGRITTPTPREFRLYRLADELRELTTPIGKEAATILERQASTLVLLHADLAAREAELRELRIINENLEQDLAAMHELFRKVTGYTAIEYAMMRESVKEGS